MKCLGYERADGVFVVRFKKFKAKDESRKVYISVRKVARNFN
jgi:hypothetical protein